MRRRAIFVLLLSLLMFGGALSNSVYAKPSFIPKISVTKFVLGIYDPNPTMNDDLRDARKTFAILRIQGNKLTGFLFYGLKVRRISKNIRIVESEYFDGYVILFDSKDTENGIIGLQGNIYKNGTVWIFLQEIGKKNIIALSFEDKQLVERLSKMKLPKEKIDDISWSFKIVPPKINIHEIASGKEIILMGGVQQRCSYSTKAVYITSSWPTNSPTTYYIKVQAKFCGPTILKSTDEYKVIVKNLDEGRIVSYGTSYREISGDTAFEIRGSPSRPIDIKVTVPYKDSPNEVQDLIIRVSGSIVNFGYSEVSWAIKWAADLITWALNLPPIPTKATQGPTFPPIIIEGGEEKNTLAVAYNNLNIGVPGQFLQIEGIVIRYNNGPSYDITRKFYALYNVPVYYGPSSNPSHVADVETQCSLRVTHTN
ncbi:hypothetical protein VFC49_08520 [Thermococcus sp. SY098]|uniref:hypothetical protein n=1 Tax=Thermococcus sp. SY098 TaxID=3111325 RepID=UPI002D7717E6|nr:hypothetical protein [Thermococcus sp. SY098]WRS52095.1 hypothetical protein VFC49_08520 [Thermococcus sp. SY098]